MAGEHDVTLCNMKNVQEIDLTLRAKIILGSVLPPPRNPRNLNLSPWRNTISVYSKLAIFEQYTATGGKKKHVFCWEKMKKWFSENSWCGKLWMKMKCKKQRGDWSRSTWSLESIKPSLAHSWHTKLAEKRSRNSEETLERGGTSNQIKL